MAETESQQSVEGSGDGGGRRDDGLPNSFDVLIVGTGLVESIVSAAVSRNGHSVLHIDPREYYGGTWATFGFDQWMSASFMEVPPEAVHSVEVSGKDINGTVKWKNNVTSFDQHWYDEDEEIKNELIKQRRRFNIDVMPKLVAAREDIVQLLITSNVSRYLEFLRISRLLTNLPHPKEDVIEPIPLSRADIFTSKSLTLVEKRSLVKLIEAVMKSQKTGDDESVQQEAEKQPDTFEELIQAVKVSDKIRHMVKASITTLEDGFSPDGEVFNQEFSSRCRLFLNSIGRYGNQTPFLWTLYGVSEICQAFCRLSAVYGGIFILKRYLSQIKSTEDGFVIKTDEDDIKVKHIVIGPDLECEMPGRERSRKEQASAVIGRAVFITKGGNIKAPDDTSKVKGDGIFLYRISGMEVIEMNHNSQAVPKDFRLIQISFPVLEEEVQNCNCRKEVEEKLSQFLNFHTPDSAAAPNSSAAANDETGTEMSDVIVNEEPAKPQVIYGSYFMLNVTSSSISCELLTNNGSDNAKNFFVESSVASTDLTNYVSKAQNIFSTLYPDEEFLPKAPDCDENDEVNGDDDGNNEDPPAIPSNSNDAGDDNNDNVAQSSGNEPSISTDTNESNSDQQT